MGSLNMRRGWLADLQDNSLQLASMTSTDLPCTSSVEHSSKPSTDEETNSTAQLTVEEQGKLQKALKRLNVGLASYPNVFVPAVRKMLVNIDHHAATEAGMECYKYYWKVQCCCFGGKDLGPADCHRFKKLVDMLYTIVSSVSAQQTTSTLLHGTYHPWPVSDS